MKSKLLLHVLLIFVITICFANADGYVYRIIGNDVRACVKYYNCPPGYEILPCINPHEKELCQKCYDDPSTSGPDFVQPDYISSDDAELKCFKPLTIAGVQSRCTGQDQTYSRTESLKANCQAGKGCKCNLTACYYGDPCICRRANECQPNYHLNDDGHCIPCPAGTYRNNTGCAPCLRDPSARTDPTTTAVSKSSTINVTPVVTPAPTTVTVVTTDSTTTSSTTVQTTVSSKPVVSADSTPIIIGVTFAVLVLFFICFIIIMCKKGKFEKIKQMCRGDRGPFRHEAELQPMVDVPREQEDNRNNIRLVNQRQNSVEKPNNNHILSIDIESDRLNSENSVSINRQLSNISSSDRLNSNSSENCQLLRSEINNSHPHSVTRLYSVPILESDRTDSFTNPHIYNRAVSVPQQVSSSEDSDFLLNMSQPLFHNSSSQLVPSPTSGCQPFMENSRGACIPLPDFDNIQSSSPVMNTELPDIREYKRSLSKDSTSSVELASSSPFSSIPEETGKELHEEVAADHYPSTIVSNQPHLSEEFSDCHQLSNYPDVPQDSDITNPIDSRLEQYNHTVTGTDDEAACSVHRLPSEHEEETMKKKDLESNLDSGMQSKGPDSRDLSKSDLS